MQFKCDNIEPKSETGDDFIVTLSLPDPDEALFEVTSHGPFMVRVKDASGFTIGAVYELTEAVIAPGVRPAAADDEGEGEGEGEEAHGHKRRRR